MDSYKKNFYEEMTLKKLKDVLAKKKKEAEQIGKELPNLEGTEKEMRLKEYNSALEDIDDIKAIVKQKQSEKDANKPATMEKLFPTVMKVAHKRASKAAVEESSEETAEEPEVSEEVAEAEIEEEDTRSDVERLNDMYDDIRDILEDIDAEANATQAEIKEKVTQELSKGKSPAEVEEISRSKRSRENQSSKQWTSLDELMEQHSANSNVIEIEPLSSENSKSFNGDIATEVLASTEDELLARPVPVITDDMVKNLSKEDVKREKYRMDNFKRALVKALNGIPKDTELRKEVLRKITIIEGNLSIVLKYS